MKYKADVNNGIPSYLINSHLNGKWNVYSARSHQKRLDKSDIVPGYLFQSPPNSGMVLTESDFRKGWNGFIKIRND